MSNAYKSFFKLEFKALMREPVSLFFMIVLPIILTIVFGGAFGSEATSYGKNVLGIDTVVPVNIVFLLTNVGLMGIPITIIEIKDQEVLKRYMTYPTSYRVYFFSLISVFTFVSFLSTLLFSLISFVFYGATWHMTLTDTLLFALIYIAMIIIFDGIGFIIALLIKGSRTANMITSGVFLSLIFTSGVVLPVESLPVLVQKIAYIFPMYHCIKISQMIWISEFRFIDLWDNILYIIIAVFVLSGSLGRVKVKWD